MALVVLATACQAARPVAALDPITAERLSQLGGTDPKIIFPRLSPEAAFKEYQGQVTVVMPSRSEVHVLNETGSTLLTLLDGSHSVSDLANALVREYDVDYQTALRDTVEFLITLKGKGMLVESAHDPAGT